VCVCEGERERERERIPKSKKKHKTGRTPLYFFPSLTVSWEMSSNVVEAAFAEWTLDGQRKMMSQHEPELNMRSDREY